MQTSLGQEENKNMDENTKNMLSAVDKISTSTADLSIKIISIFGDIGMILAIVIAVVMAFTAIKVTVFGAEYNGVIIQDGKDNIRVKNTNDCYAVVHVEYNGHDKGYNCYIENDDEWHEVKLTYGIGEYEIMVFRVDDSTQERVYDCKKTMNEQVKYTGSSYNVEINKFKDDIDGIIKQNGWNKETDLETVWGYFNKFKYEYDVENKIGNKEVDVFIPDLHKVAESKSGICYDIASLVTCICRELYGEARLCVGERGGEYHAWCEVKQDGEWINMDTIRKDSFDSNENIGEYKTIQTY